MIIHKEFHRIFIEQLLNMEVVHIPLFVRYNCISFKVLQLPQVGIHGGVNGIGIEPVTDESEILVPEVDL